MKSARPKTWQSVSKFIGGGLSKLRKKKGFSTVKDFAVRYKLPEIQYWRMEKGKANLTLKSLSKVLNIHKVSFEDFFCDLDYVDSKNGR
jgi:transcriptional regulator with XRE-family HTH domain